MISVVGREAMVSQLWPLGQRDQAGASREVLRQVMRRWTTGVTVVTVRCGQETRGVTINSFTSVSLEPPLVLICIDRRARTNHLILASERFCINILDERQQVLSDRFAGRHPGEHARFDDCSRQETPGGLPALDGSLAWLDCRLFDTHAVGDHTIFIGLVVAASTADVGQPLIYQAGHYRRLPAGPELAGSEREA
jgi:flavin reductase (DIM6/NTAB) family NADH-FMN oxidoreductase RutF